MMVLAIWEMVDRSPLTTSCFDSSAFSYSVCACVCVRAHAVPLGQTAWRMELCHFGDCFPGIVFLDVPVVLLEHYKSIKRSFLRFFFPSDVITCKTHQPADRKPYLSLQKMKTKVSPCVAISFSAVAYFGSRSVLVMVHSFSLWLL